MNERVATKVMDFLKSKGVEEVGSITAFNIDAHYRTLDIWFNFAGGPSDVYGVESGHLGEFLEFLASE